MLFFFFWYLPISILSSEIAGLELEVLNIVDVFKSKFLGNSTLYCSSFEVSNNSKLQTLQGI